MDGTLIGHGLTFFNSTNKLLGSGGAACLGALAAKMASTGPTQLLNRALLPIRNAATDHTVKGNFTVKPLTQAVKAAIKFSLPLQRSRSAHHENIQEPYCVVGHQVSGLHQTNSKIFHQAQALLRPIEQIRAGDFVWAWDEDLHKAVAKMVTRIFALPDKPTFDVTYSDNYDEIETVRGTKEHPFWVLGKGWTPLALLQTGDKLRLINGGDATVKAVNTSGQKENVFNFEVDGAHNYYIGVEGVLVHNTSDPAAMAGLVPGEALARSTLDGNPNAPAVDILSSEHAGVSSAELIKADLRSHPELVLRGDAGSASHAYSNAFIDGVKYEITPETPEIVSRYLRESMSNNRYDSFEHLYKSATDFFANIEAERCIISSAREAMNNVESPEFKVSARMAELQMRLFSQEGLLKAKDITLADGSVIKAPTEAQMRESLALDALDPSRALNSKTSPFRPGAVEVPGAARQIFAKMMRGESGLLTEADARFGVELAASGQLVAHELAYKKAFEYGGHTFEMESPVGDARLAFRKAMRVNADRMGGPNDYTNPASTLNGLALNNDIGTVLNRNNGLMVMNGTSGTTSDAVLSTMYAADKLGTSWWPEGMSVRVAKEAIKNDALYYMRDQVVPPSMTRQFNGPRATLGLPSMEVAADSVFVHSWGEVSMAVDLTINGQKKSLVAWDYASQNAWLKMIDLGW